MLTQDGTHCSDLHGSIMAAVRYESGKRKKKEADHVIKQTNNDMKNYLFVIFEHHSKLI